MGNKPKLVTWKLVTAKRFLETGKAQLPDQPFQINPRQEQVNTVLLQGHFDEELGSMIVAKHCGTWWKIYPAKKT